MRMEVTNMETTAKEIMIKTIEAQPDDSSYDELLKELAFHRMILRGLKDSDEGRTISYEEMEKKIESWTRK